MSGKIKKVIDQIRQKGTIAPSSRFLVDKMISKIDYGRDLDLLQLGFGTGVFTKGLLKKISPQSTLVVFEIDQNCRKYRIVDPRVEYLEDSAERISEHFPTRKFDHVISTLPFASLPKKVSQNVFAEIKKHLKPGGKFLQFQYSLYSKRAIRDLFGHEPKIDFELLNLPPAFIYEAENRK
jgi:phospholipid N-methyltransferase